MNRSSFAFVALLASLVCFIVALLLTSGFLHGTDYHPWVDGGFVGLVFALLIEKSP